MTILTEHNVSPQFGALLPLLDELSSTTTLLEFYRIIKQILKISLFLDNHVRTCTNRFGSKLPHSLLIHSFTFLFRTSYYGCRVVCKNWFKLFNSGMAGQLLSKGFPTRFQILSTHKWNEPIGSIRINSSQLFVLHDGRGTISTFSKTDLKFIQEIKVEKTKNNKKHLVSISNWEISENYLICETGDDFLYVIDSNTGIQIDCAKYNKLGRRPFSFFIYKDTIYGLHSKIEGTYISTYSIVTKKLRNL